MFGAHRQDVPAIPLGSNKVVSICTDGSSILVGSNPEGREDGMKPVFCGHVLGQGRTLVAGVVKLGCP